MPIVAIRIAKGKTVDVKRAVAQRITDVVSEKVDVERHGSLSSSTSTSETTGHPEACCTWKSSDSAMVGNELRH